MMFNGFCFFNIILCCTVLYAAPKKKGAIDLSDADFDKICTELSQTQNTSPQHPVQQRTIAKMEDVQSAINDVLANFPVNDDPVDFNGVVLENGRNLTLIKLQKIVEGIKKKNLTDFESLIRIADSYRISMQGNHSAKKNLTNLYFITYSCSLSDSDRKRVELLIKRDRFLLGDVFLSLANQFYFELIYQDKIPNFFYRNIVTFDPRVVRLSLMISKGHHIYAQLVDENFLRVTPDGKKVDSGDKNNIVANLYYKGYIESKIELAYANFAAFLLKDNILVHPDGKTDISTHEKRIDEAARILYRCNHYYNLGIAIVRYHLRKHPDPSIDISTEDKANQYAAHLFWKEANNPESRNQAACFHELNILFYLINQHPDGVTDFNDLTTKMNTKIEWILKSNCEAPEKKIFCIVVTNPNLTLKIGKKILRTNGDKISFFNNVMKNNTIENDDSYEFNYFYLLQNTEQFFGKIKHSVTEMEKKFSSIFLIPDDFESCIYQKNLMLTIFSLQLKNNLARYFMDRIPNIQDVNPELCYTVELQEQIIEHEKQEIQQNNMENSTDEDSREIEEQKTPIKVLTPEEQNFISLIDLQKKDERAIKKEWNSVFIRIKNDFQSAIKRLSIHKMKQEIDQRLHKMTIPIHDKLETPTKVLNDKAKILEYPTYLESRITEIIETLKKEGRVRKSHPLIGRLSGDLLISVELDDKHRLVYKMNKNNEIEILQIGGHYDD